MAALDLRRLAGVTSPRTQRLPLEATAPLPQERRAASA
jgi:hypothetical protein